MDTAHLASLIALFFFFGLSRPASADPTPQDRTMAEALFRSGQDLAKREQIHEACAKFAESQRLDPRVGTLLHLATCHELEGKTATAWLEFTEAHAEATRTGDPRAKIARDRVVALEPRLSKVTFGLTRPKQPDAPAIEIKLDGKVVGAAIVGTEIPLDPGEHSVEASATKRTSWSKQFTVASTPGRTRIDIPELAADTSPVESQLTTATTTTTTPKQADREKAGFPILSLVLGGVAVLGAAGFGYLWIRAGDEANELNRTCAPRCSQDEVDPVRTKFILADVSLGVGIAAAVGAIAVLLFDSPSKSAAGPNR